MIKFSLNTIAALLAALPLAAIAQEEKILNVIVLTAPRIDPLGATKPSAASQDLQQLRAATSDSARLLQNIPGVSLYAAGAISSLPAIHGLADDRIRVQVDGMDLMAACPNHMNSALSYIDPSKVGSITVYAGITPVSVGGDSLGGTIQVKSAPPDFAEAGQPAFAKGQTGTFFRSNANAKGYNIGATWVGHAVNLSYGGSRSQADNYTAARDFKAVTRGRENGPLIPGNVVGSSAYSGSKNQELALALRHEEHLLQLSVSRQTVGFEGFPNQRMDMTGNQNTLLNLRYTGRHQWGELEARLYDQDTRHNMDMGPDRYSYGYGMPMDSKGKTRGATLQGSILSSGRDIVRLGAEYQQYTLYDWWPAVGGTMGPNAYWNVDYGQRNKIDVYSEWETSWNTQWLSQIGVRSTTVRTNAAPVQGYDNGLAGLWGNEAAAFNALDRKRTEHNWDLSAIARYTPDATQHYEAGYARKSRSPSLYQRYPWSTQPMAALMNNFVGDGNGYVGNVDLRPEVAHSVSVTGNWQGADAQQWGLTATGYATYVQDYIDARRCDFNQCSAANVAATTGFVLLQYANQSARLYGIDLSAHLRLGKTAAFGNVTGTGLLNYVRGENRTTGDDLYNIMPFNVKLALVQSLGAWSNTAEFQWVAAKRNVSQVRNEMRTGAYGLLNLRSSYEWQHARLDIGIENALHRFYAMPLGGAYVGQGASMTSNGIPWGVPVPGIGRSINIALNLHF